jgi:hypothetical protein
MAVKRKVGLAVLRAKLAAKAAEVKRWEDKEVHRASTCCGQQERAERAEEELAALRAVAVPLSRIVIGTVVGSRYVHLAHGKGCDHLHKVGPCDCGYSEAARALEQIDILLGSR